MKKLFLLFLFLPALLAFPNEIAAQKECQVPLVDEVNEDPSFLAFRVRLQSIIKRRDKVALLAILDPKITVSFGGDVGKKDFEKYWDIDSKRTRLWDELGTVIANGGYMTADGDVSTFSAPYSFEGFPGSCPVELDLFVHQIIFGKDVALRREPSVKGELITRLSYNVVTLVGEKTVTRETGEHAVPEWYFVKSLGGLEGYVNAKYVRSPIDYRAIFQKRDNRWLMVAFVAGD
jgi:hypothetical protein